MAPAVTRRSAALIAIVAVVSGCDSLGLDRKSIILPITDLSAPASVVDGQTLVAQVEVQTGGCRSFNELEVRRTTGKITLVAIGSTPESRSISCPADVRTEVVEFRTDGPFTDPFVLVGTQPGGKDIERTIRLMPR